MGGSAGAEARKTRRRSIQKIGRTLQLNDTGIVERSPPLAQCRQRRSGGPRETKQKTRRELFFHRPAFFRNARRRISAGKGRNRGQGRRGARKRWTPEENGYARILRPPAANGMAPRPESLQSAIPNPARIRKWECVSKRRIHRSEICIEPQDGGSFGRKERMDANPIGKRAAGWLHGNSPKGTSRIENRNRAKRAPPKPRDGTLPKKQSRLAQGKTGGAENPKRSLLRIRPWAREIRAEPAEHGAKTPAGMAAALRKKRTCLPLRQGETYRDRSDGRGCFSKGHKV